MNRLQKLTALDTRIFYWCTAKHQAKGMAVVSLWCSRLGDGLMYLVLGLGLALWDDERGQQFLWNGLFAYALELPLYLLLKNTIRRDRPCHRLDDCEAAIEPSDKFSFPSGHAAAAFLFAVLVMAYYPAMALPAFVLASMIGAARVLLGVHYPTDIAAGALLGTCSGALVLHLWSQF